MGVRDGVRALVEHWDRTRRAFSGADLDELVRLVTVFTTEAVPRRSVVAAQRITRLLARTLPDGHPVLAAVTAPDSRWARPDADLTALGEWLDLSAALRSRLLDSEPPPTAEQIRLAITRRLLAAPALTAADLRELGLSPDDPELIQLADADARRWPSFQFADDGPPDVVRAVNRLLEVWDDPWGGADWWLGEHAALGAPPATMIGLIADERLIAAASAERAEG